MIDDRMSRRVPLIWQGLAPPLPTTTPARQPASAAVGTAAAAASAASSSTHVLSGAVVGGGGMLEGMEQLDRQAAAKREEMARQVGLALRGYEWP